jgi:hypothetical protein
MFLIAGLLVTAACEPAPPVSEDLPEFGEAFPNLPLPASAKVVARQGSRDALQFVLEVPQAPEAMVSMYRTHLSTSAWRLISDTRDSAGTVTLYAEGQQPLWVRIAGMGGGMTRIELSGAVPGRDSSYVRRRKAAADTSNTLRPRSILPPQEP